MIIMIPVIPSEPYDVAYSETFGPYVVVSTDSEPNFDELLLKRTAEKRFNIYGCNLPAFGVL